MKKYISNNIINILGIILLIVLWEIIHIIVGQGNMIFPSSYNTFKHVAYLLTRKYTYECILYSLLRMIYGFILSFIFALLFGTIAGNNKYIEKIFNPIIICLRAIPTASLIYLFIVLAGYKFTPSYLVCLISFPIIYEGVVSGINNIPNEIINASKIDGANNLKSIIRIKLPLAFSYIIVSMISSFSLSFKIEIMAEVITGASLPGLGSAILGARVNNPVDMVPIFAYSIIAIFIMIIIDYFIDLIEK